MGIEKFNPGSKIHCIEQSSDQYLSGTLEYKPNGIYLKLFSYGDEIQYPELNPIFVKTENNQCFSLYANRLHGQSRIGWDEENSKNCVTSHTERSALVVIGQDFWPNNRLVKRFRFKLKHVDGIFTFTQQHKKIQHQKQETITNQLFTIRCGNIIVRYRFAISGNVYDEFYQAKDPYFEVDVTGGVDLEEYFLLSKYVAGFFSLLFGIMLHPYDYKISNYSLAIYHRRMTNNANGYFDDHEVIYPGLQTQEDESNYLRQIFFVGGHIIPNLRECLKFWIARRDKWEKTIELMMQNLPYRAEFSRERLLSACRWFEEIPTVESQNAITKEHSNEISETAGTKASNLGYDSDMSKRIYHAVSNIRDETRRTMIARLCKNLTASFGTKLLNKQFLDDLEHAFKYRGVAAHTLFKFDSDQKRQNAIRGTLALELLNLMLTVVDIPLNRKFFELFENDARVREYMNLHVEVI